MHSMIMWLLLQTVCRGQSVCWSVDHDREPCKNGQTDRGAIWDDNSRELGEPCFRQGPGDSFVGRGTSRGT